MAQLFAQMHTALAQLAAERPAGPANPFITALPVKIVPKPVVSSSSSSAAPAPAVTALPTKGAAPVLVTNYVPAPSAPSPPVPINTDSLPPALASTVQALHSVAQSAAQSGDAASQEVAAFVGNLANQITQTAQAVQGSDVVVGITPTPSYALSQLFKNPVTWAVLGGVALLLVARRR